MMKFLAGVITTLIIVSIAAAAYFLGLKNSPPPTTPQVVEITNNSNPTLTPTVSTTLTPTPSVAEINANTTTAIISQSISAKDYTTLAKSMTTDVTIGAYASGCCQTNSKQEVINELTASLKDIKGPWDFSDANPIAKQLVAKEPQTFKDKIIGTSAERKTLVFTLNDKFLISRVFMVNDWKLVLP